MESWECRHFQVSDGQPKLNPLADTGCPKKRTPSAERQAESITRRIGPLPNPKGCRRGTGDSLNAGEMKLNWREKLGTGFGL
jgi:hypothetical protein